MKYMLSEIARICGGELIGEDLPVARVLTDSRNCSFGEEPLFVAMKGTNHDSHAFIGEMVRRDVKAFRTGRPWSRNGSPSRFLPASNISGRRKVIIRSWAWRSRC